jgi:hypothetical protein
MKISVDKCKTFGIEKVNSTAKRTFPKAFVNTEPIPIVDNLFIEFVTIQKEEKNYIDEDNYVTGERNRTFVPWGEFKWGEFKVLRKILQF